MTLLVERLRAYDAEDKWHPMHPPKGLIEEAANALEAAERERDEWLRCHRAWHEKAAEAEARAAKVEADLKAAREVLPPDPSLNAPWSQCIAILDEALARLDQTPETEGGDG